MRGKEGVPVIHNAELKTVVSSRKMERVLWRGVSRKSQRAAAVSVEPHVHTASRSLFSVTVGK